MNRQLFDLYRDSERGKRAVELFTIEEDTDIRAFVENLIDHAKEWGCDMSIDKVHNFIPMFCDNADARGLWDGDLTRESWAEYIDWYELIIPDYEEDGTVTFSDDPMAKIIRQENYRNKAAVIPFQSLFLYCYETGFFKPMLLGTRHDIFIRNCEALGATLPPLPHSAKHRDCCIYYYDLCQAIEDFQTENGLTEAEVCAAVYDFASMLVNEQDNAAELPSPTNVWLTGASGEDFKFLDTLGVGCENINPSNIWACNERTRRGDIMVICCLSPRSCIHSIWRANSSGIFNPFDYYHCRTTVCDGVKIPPIKTKEMKADSHFSQVPIVRKNFQGINGWELTAKDYSELLRMIEEHGGDTSNLPRLFDGSDVAFDPIQNEHDVEENILILTLLKLGYSKTDWTRQLVLKFGRGNKGIPDFVFFAHKEKDADVWSSPMVIEAKLDMSSMAEMQNAYSQALSYARMLRSSLMAICDKERIVVYNVNKDGCADINRPVYDNHWASVFSDEAEGGKLKQIIGRENVLNLI